MGANSLIKYDTETVSFPKLSNNADRQQLCTAKDARNAIPLSHREVSQQCMGQTAAFQATEMALLILAPKLNLS